MNDLQLCELDLLKEAIRVIEKHNLRYFLIGGTTLGAVRHGGFIPWDDDIDIAMPRKDYDKFMKLSEEFTGKYFLQNFETDPKYPYNFAKLRNSETTFKEKQFSHIKMNHGVYIDIFPMDGISTKEVATRRNKWKIYSVWLRFYIIYCGRLRRKVSKHSFFKDVGCNIVSVLFAPFNFRHHLNKSIEKTMHKVDYDDACLVANIQGANFGKEIVHKIWFGKGKLMKFEDIEAVVQVDTDSYLTKIYGDYMTPPPPEKQEGHHYHRGFSLEESYLTYTDKNKDN